MSVTISRAFRDISLSFKKHPITRDLVLLRNENAIKNAVMNLVRTSVGERFFNNRIGTEVESSYFELQTPELRIQLENEITSTLNNNEPRIRLRNVTVSFPTDSNELEVGVVYDIIGLSLPVQDITFILQPTRV
ncbi:MAG TPA: GPW/gp25 family protein [Prochlorococcaceae cyanobacterium AMR_MDS_5431]|nr:GPW/gp25 family protein [Prochlorococcaceae cyanobacterium AMR_MDS_5431]